MKTTMNLLLIISYILTWIKKIITSLFLLLKDIHLSKKTHMLYVLQIVDKRHSEWTYSGAFFHF
jgi:hypothetical protein